ncbi:MAG: tetratricopeptide repeat protein [Planctomycetota bacterium]|nr:tetratricopeptide repeat protein [Planctomycetota bacterium]
MLKLHHLNILTTFAMLIMAFLVGCKDSSTPNPATPVLSDLSSLDPTAADYIREKHQAVLATLDDAILRADLAMAFHAHAMFDSAATSYQEALKLDESQTRWWYLLARAQKSLDQDEAALASIEQAIQRNADYPALRVRQGFWQLDLGRFEKAALAFEAALAIEPHHPIGKIGLARVRLSQDQTDEAISMLADLRRDVPRDPYIAYLLGTAYRQVGRMEEAQPLLEIGTGSQLSWRGQDPWSGDMQKLERGLKVEYQRALDYIALKRHDLGIEILNELHQRYPDELPVLTSLGGACIATKHYEEASEALQKALVLDEEHFVVHLQLASLELNQQNFDSALHHVETAIRLNSSLAHLQDLKGQILFESNNYQEAETAFLLAIKMAPDNVQSHLRLVVAYNKLGKVHPCIELLKTMIQRFPNVPDSYLMLAQIYHRMGQAVGAQEVIKVAELRFPDHEPLQRLKRSMGME